MSDFATREKNRTYYQEHREQILRATKEWRKRNREKYRAYQKEYWSKHYRNYGTKNRVADRAMRERKKPDVEKALSMFKNPQQAAAIGRSTGMNHQTGILIVECCKHYNIPCEIIKPLKKCWKGKDGKITQDELAYFVSAGEKLPRMNQDQRDALLLAWVCAGYPVRVKPQKPQTTLQKTIRAFDG